MENLSHIFDIVNSIIETVTVSYSEKDEEAIRNFEAMKEQIKQDRKQLDIMSDKVETAIVEGLKTMNPNMKDAEIQELLARMRKIVEW